LVQRARQHRCGLTTGDPRVHRFTKIHVLNICST
jgi:hypothetical protein